MLEWKVIADVLTKDLLLSPHHNNIGLHTYSIHSNFIMSVSKSVWEKEDDRLSVSNGWEYISNLAFKFVSGVTIELW